MRFRQRLLVGAGGNDLLYFRGFQGAPEQLRRQGMVQGHYHRAV